MLQTYISDFIQEEEDSEIASLLNSQIASLQQAFTEEMTRFTEPETLPKGE